MCVCIYLLARYREDCYIYIIMYPATYIPMDALRPSVRYVISPSLFTRTRCDPDRGKVVCRLVCVPSNLHTYRNDTMDTRTHRCSNGRGNRGG